MYLRKYRVTPKDPISKSKLKLDIMPWSATWVPSKIQLCPKSRVDMTNLGNGGGRSRLVRHGLCKQHLRNPGPSTVTRRLNPNHAKQLRTPYRVDYRHLEVLPCGVQRADVGSRYVRNGREPLAFGRGLRFLEGKSRVEVGLARLGVR